MENLKNEILKELIRLTERDYQAPPEILDALKEKLKMNPLIRYVDSLKAVNSLPPSYEIRLLNGQSFNIYYEDFSLMVKIGSKEYYLMDMSERNEAMTHINKLLTIKPIPPFTTPEEEGEEEGEETIGGTTGGTTPSPGGGDPNVAMEPDDEEGEEPEEDEEDEDEA